MSYLPLPRVQRRLSCWAVSAHQVIFCLGHPQVRISRMRQIITEKMRRDLEYRISIQDAGVAWLIRETRHVVTRPGAGSS